MQFLAVLVIKTSMIFCAAWFGVLWLRSISAATRHLLWSVAFAGVLALPLLSFVTPALSLPLSDAPSFIFQTTTRATSQAIPGRTQEHAVATGHRTLAAALPGWRVLLILAWAIGAALSFGRMLAGWAAINRLRDRARPLRMLDQVRLLETPPGSMPMTCGIWRPAILIPADAGRWSAERVRMVMLHEMAHVRRYDVATHTMARTVLCLHWWNPLAWAAWREFVKERERAADDLVLSAGERSSDYAVHLLEIARSMQASPGVAMASASYLESRMSAILDPTRNRRPAGRISVAASVLAAAVILAPLAALQAQSSGTSLQSGDAARDEGKYAEAKALYTKAVNASGDRATALIHRGTTELATRDYPAAISDFELAQQQGDKQQTVQAKMWLAVAQQDQGDVRGASTRYQGALAAADPKSSEAAVIRELYAQLLQQNSEPDEAAKLLHEAAEVRNSQAKRAAATTPSDLQVYHVGAGVAPPILKSKVEPQYSAEARIAHYQGTIVVRVEIGSDGLPDNIHIIRPLGLGLDEKAMEAVAQWRFQPGTRQGKPVTVLATIEVNFRLV